jgi:hypothetical protein
MINVKDKLKEGLFIYLTLQVFNLLGELILSLSYLHSDIVWRWGTFGLFPIFFVLNYLIVTSYFQNKRRPENYFIYTRTFFWTIVILIDILVKMNVGDNIGEHPIYFLYLNNTILIPLTILPIKLLTTDNELLRKLNGYFTFIILTGAIEFSIIKFGHRLKTIINERGRISNNQPPIIE